MKSRNLSVMMLSVCLMGVAVWRQATVRGQAQEVQAARAARQDQPVERYEEAGRAGAARPRWAEDALAQSRAFLNGEADFTLVAAEQDDLGQTHVRLAQQYRGLPVFGVQVVTHAGAKGIRQSGRALEGLNLDATPVLTPAQATETAERALRYLGQFGRAAEPALVVLPHALFDRNDATGATLAWQVELPAANGAILRAFLDARTGRVRWHYNHTPVESGAVELIQANESGALQVSFADIQSLAKSDDRDSMAEQTLRKMAAPAVNHISKLAGGSDYVPAAGNDNCWVRENAGIPNQAFFLLVEGGTHAVSEVAVAGIGREKAIRIFQRALRALPPNARFADAREESVQAAAELFGKGSRGEIATADTWSAVGMTSSTTACTVAGIPTVYIPQEGGQVTIPITVSSPSCAWEVDNDYSWITVVSGASGAGNGSVTISVGPNLSEYQKDGELYVLGKIITVRQKKNPCSIAEISFGQTINGQLSSSDCFASGVPARYNDYDEHRFRYVDIYRFSGAAGQPITISMNSSTLDSYLKLQREELPISTIATGDDTIGSLNARIPGTFTFVLPKTGQYAIWATSSPKLRYAQTGTYSLTLSTTCTYALGGTLASLPYWSTTASVDALTAGNCGWTARSSVPWIQILNSADWWPTAGNGKLFYTVSPNLSSQARVGTITIMSQTFTVVQAGLN